MRGAYHRRKVLELCLQATRAGLLDLRWDLLCPLCRGVKDSGSTLEEMKQRAHCGNVRRQTSPPTSIGPWSSRSNPARRFVK